MLACLVLSINIGKFHTPKSFAVHIVIIVSLWDMYSTNAEVNLPVIYSRISLLQILEIISEFTKNETYRQHVFENLF